MRDRIPLVAKADSLQAGIGNGVLSCAPRMAGPRDGRCYHFFVGVPPRLSGNLARTPPAFLRGVPLVSRSLRLRYFGVKRNCWPRVVSPFQPFHIISRGGHEMGKRVRNSENIGYYYIIYIDIYIYFILLPYPPLPRILAIHPLCPVVCG